MNQARNISTHTVAARFASRTPRPMRQARLLLALLAIAVPALPQGAQATANYVYHERTGADVTGGAANTCGGAQAFVPTLNPSSAQSYLLRFKVEYQFFTDTLKVYYTTDGSNPSGALGVGSGTTAVVPGSYQCTFTSGADTVDVGNATIPAQPAGTIVKYIVSAWHSGGGPEIFANSGTCAGCGDCELSSCATIFQYTVGSTTTLYWDINGATAGAGGATPTGTWDATLANWSSVFDGTATTAAWVAGRNAVFSAGTDASGAFTVTLTGTHTVAGVTVEEGTVSFAGSGAASIGTGPVTINSGATLSVDNAARIAQTPGSVLTLNGGTMRNTNPGSAGSFIDLDAVIALNGGGTISYTTAGVLNIINPTTIISGTGPLTKTGAGILAIASPCSYSGATIINDGTLRLRYTAPAVSNRLPIGTDVIINSPGVLDPGSTGNTIQQVNTVNGNGNITYSASSTLLIAGAADSTIMGVISDGAVNGRISKQGGGTLTLSGLNTYDGRFTNDAGTTTITPSGTWCGAVCDVYINGGIVNLNNAAQTVENLVGAGGTINLASGHMLTVSPVSGSTYSGTIAGPGGITKVGTSTETLSGPNTYDGTTFVNAGKLGVGSATGLGSTVGGTEVASGGELLFDGVATSFTISEPLKIAGPGGGDGGAITVQNSANVTISGPVTLTGDTTNTVSGTGTVLYNNPGSITALANQNLTLQGGGLSTGNGGTISGVISLGTGALTKLQGGRWTLSGANSYSGGTLISAGTLRVANTTGSATGSGDVTVASGATLSGAGSVAGAIAVSGTISPGASPGTLNSGAETWNGGGSYTWEINDAAGTQGADPGWDFLNINGTLTIAADPGNKFNVNVRSLTLANAIGDAANFNNAQDYTWTIATASGGISGFDPAAFNLNTATFSNAVANGLFLIEQSGNSIRVRFVHPPTIACPGTISQGTDPGLCTSAVTWTTPTTGSAPVDVLCKVSGGVLPVNLPVASPYNFPKGTTMVTCTATNLYGTNSCGFDVTVNDTQPPVFNCGQNETVSCMQGWGFTFPIVNDNCDGLISGSAVPISTTTNFTCGYTFIATRIWQVTDSSANTAYCTQVVTYVDFIPPTITVCPGNVTVQCIADVPAPDISSVTATNQFDPCDTNAPVVAHFSDVTNGVCPKIITRTYRAYDACSNVAQCVQTITVQDTTPPSITCPTNMTVQCFGDIPAADPALATATDNCGDVTKTFVGDTYATNGCMITVTRTYKATDSCTNETTCAQTITVQDTTAPTIDCGVNQTVECGQAWSFNAASVSDNCDTNPVLTVVSTLTNSTCGNAYVATKVWQAVDACANTMLCTQVVTVVDTTAPSISHCATNRAVGVLSGSAPLPDMTGEIVASDCSGTILVSQSPAPGTSIPIGTTVVTFFVSDSCQNTNLCTANFIVFMGNAPPTATDKGGATTLNVPFSITIAKLLSGNSDLENDPLTLVSVSATSTNGGAVVLGATRVTYTPLPGFTGVDRFSFTIADDHGGESTANVVVLVVAGDLPSQNQVSLATVPGGVRVRFAGIPGFTYSIQRATTLTGPWTSLNTQVAPAHGIIEYLDTNPPGGSAFYRTAKP